MKFSKKSRYGLIALIDLAVNSKYEQSADKLSVAKILEALEGDYHIERETLPDNGDYPEISETVQKLVIDRVNEQMDSILKNLTLADLEQNYLDDRKYGQHMYYI